MRVTLGGYVSSVFRFVVFAFLIRGLASFLALVVHSLGLRFRAGIRMDMLEGCRSRYGIESNRIVFDLSHIGVV